MDKKRGILSMLLSLILAFSIVNGSPHAEGTAAIQAETADTDRVIVTLEEGAAPSIENAETIETVEAEQLLSVEVPASETLDEFMEELESRDEVKEVIPDHILQRAYTPNDPKLIQYQYHLPITGVIRAWDRTMGSPEVIVAVLDDGLDANHPELAGRVVSPFDAVTGTSKITKGEHGTHIAGIIAGSANNRKWGAGVAPKSRLMPINVFDGEYAYTSDVITGIHHAVNSGADIINMSLGSEYYNPAFDEAVQFAYQNGLVIAAAAGNSGTEKPDYPAAYKNVISVTSITASNNLSWFSNYGNTIDLSAPGSNIYSSLPGNLFGPMSGTSMASPVVAGIAALLMAAEPSLTNDEVVARLFTTADDLGAPGKDRYFGNGRVNAKKALKLKDFPALQVKSVNDKSVSVRGTVPFAITNGQIRVENQAGKQIAAGKGYAGKKDFKITIPKQAAGTKLSVTIADGKGGLSKKATVTVKDATAPAAPTANSVSDKATAIIGKAESKAKVTAFAGKKKIGEATAKDGKYSMKIAKQKAGTAITLYATDPAGNKSAKKTVKVADKTPPAVPKVNKVTSKSLTVSGKSEKGAAVFVYRKSVKIGKGTADSKGNFKVKIKTQKKASVLTVYAQDKAGNKSKKKAVTVK